MRSERQMRAAGRVVAALGLVATLWSVLASAQVGDTVSLYDAIRDGRAAVTIRGTGASSGPAVVVDVAKGPRARPGDLRLRVPPGAMLRSGNGAAQNMVIASVLGRYRGELAGSVRYSPATEMVVSTTTPVAYVLDAYCAQFERDNPGPSDRFTLEPPDATLGAILRAARSLSVAARQAAVWVHTDRVTRAHLNEKFAVTDEEWTQARTAYDTGRAAATRAAASQAPARATSPPSPQPAPTLASQGGADRSALTNAGVVAMVKAGIAAPVIVLAIDKQGGSFDTSPSGLIALKEQGVPDVVLSAMLNASAPAGRAEGTRAPAAGALPRVRPDARDPDIQWAYIPAGTFEMGEYDFQKHTVTLTRPFELMTTEVTLAMWQRTPMRLPILLDTAKMSAREPVAWVKWNEALGVCQALGGRLPTEAEWEYAARGGLAGATYPWGNEEPVRTPGARNGAAFSDWEGSGESRRRTGGPDRALPVATFAPNGWGLFDMAGNADEWVADWYAEYLTAGVTDPQGPTSGERRVLRGGSWNYFPRLVRVSYRNGNPPDLAYYGTGVRCARDLSP